LQWQGRYETRILFKAWSDSCISQVNCHFHADDAQVHVSLIVFVFVDFPPTKNIAIIDVVVDVDDV